LLFIHISTSVYVPLEKLDITIGTKIPIASAKVVSPHAVFVGRYMPVASNLMSGCTQCGIISSGAGASGKFIASAAFVSAADM